jgi:hypothetical protein
LADRKTSSNWSFAILRFFLSRSLWFISGFENSILPYTNADWEMLSIFLTFLVPPPTPASNESSIVYVSPQRATHSCTPATASS